ncbi:MAG: peptidoglycan DD-metalloendopeptidase family protein [Patescibacteria group bacterium]
MAIFLASFLFGGIYYAQTESSDDATTEINESGDQRSLLELNIEIEKRREEINNLQQKTKSYEDSIKSKQQESASLTNQILIIEDEISKTGYEIEIAATEIEKLTLEIDNLNMRIDTKEAEITVQKERISELVRQIYKADQKTYLEITLGYEHFSDFFNQLKFLKEVESQNQDLLEKFGQLKTDLELRESELSSSRVGLADKRVELERTEAELDDQVGYKSQVLDETVSSEEKFQGILDELKTEQSAINSELASLERVAKEKLQLEDRDFDLGEGAGILSWPVSPAGGISAYFHDPSYLYRWIFEHPAIDIRVPQGTAVAAVADGYVVRAKNAGKGYSYIMLAHGNDLTSVYGHISQINVQEDSFVERGQIIGLSGGKPGSNGAGRLTTGAHLHFEVRLNGIPVNPLNYLP